MQNKLTALVLKKVLHVSLRLLLKATYRGGMYTLGANASRSGTGTHVYAHRYHEAMRVHQAIELCQ